jgi:sugar/nucleoside kinase (ribokinase family)
MRERLAELAERDPGKIVLADSRMRIGLFRNVWLKPNERECLSALAAERPIEDALRKLAAAMKRPVVCTRGDKGMLIAGSEHDALLEVPGFRVEGPIDTVGAGDSSSAGLACALSAGVSLAEAAAFANLVASITIQQIGVTGTASPEQVRRRWAYCTSS